MEDVALFIDYKIWILSDFFVSENGLFDLITFASVWGLSNIKRMRKVRLVIEFFLYFKIISKDKQSYRLDPYISATLQLPGCISKK